MKSCCSLAAFGLEPKKRKTTKFASHRWEDTQKYCTCFFFGGEANRTWYNVIQHNASKLPFEALWAFACYVLCFIIWLTCQFLAENNAPQTLGFLKLSYGCSTLRDPEMTILKRACIVRRMFVLCHPVSSQCNYIMVSRGFVNVFHIFYYCYLYQDYCMLYTFDMHINL